MDKCWYYELKDFIEGFLMMFCYEIKIKEEKNCNK